MNGNGRTWLPIYRPVGRLNCVNETCNSDPPLFYWSDGEPFVYHPWMGNLQIDGQKTACLEYRKTTAVPAIRTRMCTQNSELICEFSCDYSYNGLSVIIMQSISLLRKQFSLSFDDVAKRILRVNRANPKVIQRNKCIQSDNKDIKSTDDTKSMLSFSQRLSQHAQEIPAARFPLTTLSSSARTSLITTTTYPSWRPSCDARGREDP